MKEKFKKKKIAGGFTTVVGWVCRRSADKKISVPKLFVGIECDSFLAEIVELKMWVSF
jgi:hypothetical protein